LIFGLTTFNEISFSEFPGGLVYGIQSSVARFGTESFATDPTDAVANTFIAGRIRSGLRIGREIDTGPSREFGSLLVAKFGEIEIVNIDGALDPLVDDWFVDGRQARILIGSMQQDQYGRDRVASYDAFALIYTAISGAWSLEHDVVRLRLRDRGIALQHTLQQTTYLGTGGQQGTPDMAGKTLPVCLGRGANLPAQQVDPGFLTYQVHDAAVSAITAVYDAGAVVPWAANYTTYGALTGATIPAGMHATSVETGYFRLGTTPFGTVTADVDGDISGGFVSTHGEVLAVVLDRYSSLEIGDLDSGSFTTLAAIQPAVMGLFLEAGDRSTVEDVVARIALSCGAVVGQDRSGLYRAFRLDIPSGVGADWAFDDNDIIDIDRERLPYGVPWASWAVAYARNWRVQTGGDVAAGVSETRRRFLEREARYAFHQSLQTALAHPSWSSIQRESLFASQAAASAEATRLANFYGLTRKLYRVVVKNVLFQMRVGDVVRLTYPRWQLKNGRALVVVAVDDDAGVAETEFMAFG
jgi:hypothetical protein